MCKNSYRPQLREKKCQIPCDPILSPEWLRRKDCLKYNISGTELWPQRVLLNRQLSAPRTEGGGSGDPCLAGNKLWWESTAWTYESPQTSCLVNSHCVYVPVATRSFEGSFPPRTVPHEGKDCPSVSLSWKDATSCWTLVVEATYLACPLVHKESASHACLGLMFVP